MKKIIFALLILSIWGCSGPQRPVFLRLENIKVTNISTRNITITGEALLHNPNALGGTLVHTDIDIINRDISIAKIVQTIETLVPAQTEFRIPLTFNTSPKELFEQKGKGILGGVINALVDKSITLNYKGTMTFKFAGISFETPIDFKEEVDW